MLDTLDLFGIALGMAAFRPGRPSRTRRSSAPCYAGSAVSTPSSTRSPPVSEVRYRRLLDAVAELEKALAAQARKIGGPIGEFLRDDDTVLARMAAAVDVALAVGLNPFGPVGRSGHAAGTTVACYSHGPNRKK